MGFCPRHCTSTPPPRGLTGPRARSPCSPRPATGQRPTVPAAPPCRRSASAAPTPTWFSNRATPPKPRPGTTAAPSRWCCRPGPARPCAPRQARSPRCCPRCPSGRPPCRWPRPARCSISGPSRSAWRRCGHWPPTRRTRCWCGAAAAIPAPRSSCSPGRDRSGQAWRGRWPRSPRCSRHGSASVPRRWPRSRTSRSARRPAMRRCWSGWMSCSRCCGP